MYVFMQIVWLAPLSSLPFLSEMSSLTEGNCVAWNRSDVLNFHTITPTWDTMLISFHACSVEATEKCYICHAQNSQRCLVVLVTELCKNWVFYVLMYMSLSVSIQFESSAEFYGQNYKALGYDFVLIMTTILHVTKCQ